MTYEFSLSIFTVFGQLAAGMALMIWLTRLHRFPEVERRAWKVSLALGILAVIAAALHLSVLLPAPLSITKFGSSWLSREIVVGIIFGILMLLRIFSVIKEGLNWLPAIAGICFVLVMSQVYFQNVIVPMWNTWGIVINFIATLLLGSTAIMAIAPETRKDDALRTCAAAAFLGAVFSLAMPVFWLGSMLAPLEPAMLDTFAIAAICLTLSQMACFSLGGILIIYGLPNKQGLIYLGAILVVVGAVLGRMLFYAANIKIGF